MCARPSAYLQAQKTYIRRAGGREGEREKERGGQAVKFLLPQTPYHLSPPEKKKSPECETAATAAAVQNENTNRLRTSKMPADMFR